MKNTTAAKLFVLALLAASLVAAATWFGLNTLDSLVKTVERSSQPDALRSHIDAMIFRLNAAESNMKSYTLSNNEHYRINYLEHIDSLNKDTVRLQLLAAQIPSSKTQVQILSKLLVAKQEIHFSLMRIRYVDVLDDSAILKINPPDTILRINNQPAKNNFLRRIFSKNKIKSEQLYDSLQNRKLALQALQANMNASREFTNSKINELITNELLLIRRDDSVSNAIHSLLTNLQQAADELNTLEAKAATTTVQAASKRLQWLAIAGSLLLMVLVLAIYRDLVRAAKLRRDLNAARKKAEALAKAKELFLAEMSHEMRTPLSAIAGMSSLMQNNNSNPHEKYVEAIHHTSNHLLDLLNDLLDEASMHAGKLKLSFSNFSLTTILKEVDAILNPKASSKNISCTIQNNCITEFSFHSDPIRIKQILINVAGNAIKYTNFGNVHIIVNCIQQKENNCNLEFTINDTGKGMPQSRLQNLFERFENDIDQQRESTGLGLSITKQLVDMFNGTIDVKSEVNVGSTFIVTIPVIVSNERSNTEKVIASSSNVFNSKNILVLEDDEWNGLIAKEMLTVLGANVTLVVNGVDAIQALDNSSFQIAFFDIQLPDISGIDLIQQLRSNPSNLNSSIPVYALTADLIRNPIEGLINIGFTDAFLKPLSFEKLTNYFQNKNKVITENNHTMNYSLDAIERLTNKDPKAMEYFISLFIKTSTETLSKLQLAIREKNFETAAANAHKLIPSYQQFKVEELIPFLQMINEYKSHYPSHQEALELIEIVLTQSNKLFECMQQELTLLAKK
jgi:signal transduction histidine kinase/DNA-binding response OmpR family regulator